MGLLKVYIKRGKPNYKESRMITALQKALSEKLSQDPSFTFAPANNIEELQKLHTEYCTETIDFEEIKTEKKDSTESTDAGSSDTKTAVENDSELNNNNADIVDPFNNAEPIVRDYVLDDDGFSNPSKKANTGKTNFGEPTSFGDSFELPTADDEKNGKGLATPANKKDKKQSDPVNPAFDDMDGAKKKKSTKRFARYIVEGLCTLAEHGFVYAANSEINEAKLIEYEMTGEMNLNVVLTLDNNQEATVREWFVGMCLNAETLSKIGQDDRDELSDALAEVLMEKGIAPTPMQNLLMIAGKVFVIDKGLQLMKHKAETGSVLMQLRAMKQQEIEQHNHYEQPMPKEQVKSKEAAVESETKSETDNDSTGLAVVE